MAQVGRKRFIPFRLADIDGNAVLNRQLDNFQTLHLRNGVAVTTEALALEEKGGGLYCLTYTPQATGQDFLEAYDSEHDIRVMDDEYVEEAAEAGGTGSALAMLTQNTGGDNALQADVPSPETFSLYVFRSQTWQSGDHNPLSAAASTHLDEWGNWLTIQLLLLRDVYHIVLLNGQGEEHVIRAFLDLTDPVVAPPVQQVTYTTVANETPTGACDGVNQIFTLTGTILPGTEQVYLNGMLLEAGAANDYVLQGNTLTLTFAPDAGSKLRVYYRTASDIESIPPVSGDVVISNETPSGAVNGINTTFSTIINYKPTTTRVFLNGVRLKLGTDYTESGTNQIVFSQAPLTGDLLLIDYVVQP